jgi:asparagine synthase (glutamine-hydrolysing)
MLELGGSYAGAYLLRRGLFMPWELSRVLPPDTVAEGLRRLAPLRLIAGVLEPRPRSPHARVAALEASLYMRNQLLRDTDWASMAHSLEVRVPLVDRVLLGRVAAAASATHRSWADIPKAVLGLSPRAPLPDRVLSRPKTGFATPIADWLENRGPPAPAPSWRKGRRTAYSSRQWAERLAVV